MYNFAVPHIDFGAIAPIVIVMLTGIFALIAELIYYKRSNGPVIGVSLIGLLVAGLSTIPLLSRDPEEVIGNMVVVDRFGTVVQLLLIVVCAICLLFSEGYLREKRIPFAEFYPLALWSTAGGMLMATSNNLLVIFLGLEVLSIALYVMAGMSRSENKSEESALKYFLLGAFASGFLLYGIALVYGATGSIHLESIASAWLGGQPYMRALILFGMGLMLVGFSFKSAFVPFHQWTPDVYQGAPTNVTAFMAAASKIAAIAALFRLLDATQVLRDYWMPVLFWIAILTMTVGNLVALAQKDVKRILGYSSIANAGYILVAILAHFAMPKSIGYGTTLYFLLSYSLMTVGSFAVVSMVAKGGKEETRLEDLNGLKDRSPFAAAVLVIFAVSLIGIPPTAGFFGKLNIFIDAVHANLTALAIVLAVNSAISVAYYLAIAKAAFVSEDSERTAQSSKVNPGLAGAFAVCGIGVALIGILMSPILDWIQEPMPNRVTASLGSNAPR